jgi:hypothetical protein
MRGTMSIRYPVISPYYGTVEQVIHPLSSYFYEWDTLFLIRTDEGAIEEIVADIDGCFHSCEVMDGDRVIPGMVLAYIQEDIQRTGSE